MPDPRDSESYLQKRERFSRWLLAQKDRDDWIGELAMAARGDRTFPKDGDPEAVRKHMRAQQADGDVFQAVDDAERVAVLVRATRRGEAWNDDDRTTLRRMAAADQPLPAIADELERTREATDRMAGRLGIRVRPS